MLNKDNRRKANREISDLSTREKLIKSGKRFFMEYGYKSASLRKIVADAGYTCGAFYGYFDSKEELFYTIIGEAAGGIRKLMESVGEEVMTVPPEKRLYEIGSIYVRRMPETIDFVLAHRDEIRLLLLGSDGTKYENILDKINRGNARIIEECTKDISTLPDGERPVSAYSINLLLGGFFSILARVVLENTDKETMCRCMVEVAHVFENGVISAIEKSEK